jgi:hypothetical protein
VRRLCVPVRTDQIIQRRHRILREDTSVRVPHTSGWLTIAELAARMQITRYWINRSIRNGAIRILRDTCAECFLLPNTGDTIAGIQALRSGMQKHFDIAQRAIEWVRQHDESYRPSASAIRHYRQVHLKSGSRTAVAEENEEIEDDL